MRFFTFKPSITLILTAVMALVMIAASAGMAALDLKRENSAFGNQVRARGLSLSAAVTDTFAGPISSGDEEALADAVRETRIRRELAYLAVLSADGQVQYQEQGSNILISNDGFGSNAVFTETVTQRANGPVIEFASPIMLDGRAIAGVQYGFSTDALNDEIAAIILQRAMQTGLLVLVGVVASILISRIITGSVRGLIATVHQVSNGGEYRPGTSRVAEFALLSDAVGDMVSRLTKVSKEALAKAKAAEGRTSATDTAPNAEPGTAAGAQSQAPATQQTIVPPPVEGLNPESQQYLIDAQNRMDAAIKQAKIAEDAAQMATKSAHTINNLVTPITAYSKMARQKLPPDSPLISNMQEIEEAGNRIAQLATEIQQFVPAAPLIEVTQAASEPVTAPLAEDVIDNNVVIDQNSTVALVVDDESMVRRVTTAILKAEGYTVLEASNGVEGVEIAKRFSSVPFRLLVTDVLMPMMGAKDLAVIMGDIHPETLIVFTSGYTSESLISHGALDPKGTFVQKPLTREELLEKIDEAVAARTVEINEAAGIATVAE